MPTFFFDLNNDLDAPDPEGVQLGDVAEAKRHAADEAREMALASIRETGRVDLHHSVQVRDEAGAIIATVRFGDVVQVLREGEPI